MPSPRRPLAKVFLNIPYDREFQNPCLAYVCGVCAFGFVPRATLEIPGSERRLDRIFSLIRSCEFSIHDLSRIELDNSPPRTPRFNMPFELGLAVAWERFRAKKHTWYVFEAKAHRLSKSLSDLDGTDPYIHGGSTDGIFREICNAFVRPGRQPSVQQMRDIYRGVARGLPGILRRTGAQSMYNARAFRETCVTATAMADKIVS